MFRKLLTRAQSSKRQTGRSFNPQVAGSSPAGGTSALRALRTTAPATVGPSRGGNSCEPALTGPPPALARWAGKAGARSTDSRRVAKWKRQVGYPITVGGLGCSSTNFVPPERSAARDGPRTKPPGGNRLQCSREPSGSACQATPAGGPHKPVRKRGFGVAEESVLRVGNCCGHSQRYPPRFLSYST